MGGRRRTYHNARDHPHAGGNETEGLGGFPATAGIAMGDASPVPGTSTAGLVDGIDEDTKSGEPGARDNNVN